MHSHLFGLNQKVPLPFRDQLMEMAILILAILGTGAVKKLVTICLGDECFFGFLPVRYVIDGADLILFIRLIWRVISFRDRHRQPPG